MERKLGQVIKTLEKEEIWISVALASKVLNLTTKTIRNHIKSGKIEERDVRQNDGKTGKLFINITPFFIDSIKKLQHGIKN